MRMPSRGTRSGAVEASIPGQEEFSNSGGGAFRRKEGGADEKLKSARNGENF